MADNEPTRDVTPAEPDDGFTGALTRLQENPRYRPGPPCNVRIAVDKIATERGQDQADTVAALIDDEQVSASALAEFLTKYGHTVASQTVSRHRRRQRHNGCRCPR